MPWLELYKAPLLKKPTTYGTYLDLYHTYYLPYFGEMKLCEITQDMIQTYYQGLPKSGAQKDGMPAACPPRPSGTTTCFGKTFSAMRRGGISWMEIPPIYRPEKRRASAVPSLYLAALELAEPRQSAVSLQDGNLYRSQEF